MPTFKMDLSGDFENLKISALSKSKQINAYVKNTTIGPNRSIIEDEDATTYEDTKSKLPKFTRTHTYDVTNTMIINKLRAEVENQRQVKVQEALNHHKNRILNFSKAQSLSSSQQMQRQKQVLLNEKQQQDLMIIQALEQHDKDASVKQEQLTQYYSELAERRKKIDQELQERGRRRQLLAAIIERIRNDQMESRSVYQEIINTFKNFKYQNQLKAVLGDIPKQMKALPDSMDDIVNKCKAGKVTEVECQRSSQLVQDIKGILEAVQQKIAAINEEQEQAKLESKPQPPAPQQQLPPQLSQTSGISVSQAESAPKQSSVVPTQLNKFVSISSLRAYSELQDYLDNHNKTFEELLQNDAYKQFRFNCKKAVNIPVNAISAVNAHHLLDKYNRLSSLLSGKTVEVGGTQICAAKYPQGLPFCMNLLAKKFVLQGDLMISSNPEAAFGYAAIIVALWNEHPNFGKLLLAHFHRQCPYLVPLYPPRDVAQSDQEFYRSLGYQYTDGVVEKQDKFLKRMTGIMRLYAAIIIAVPKRGQKQNPHGLSEGWKWLAAFLNLEPMPDITATLLHIFFEIAGSTMQATFGKAFQRVMVFVCRVYLPLIQKIDSGGPVTRLEVLLQEYMKVGRFEPPHDLELEDVISRESISTISFMSICSSIGTRNENLQIYTESQSFLNNFVANYEKLDMGNKTIAHICNTIVDILIKDELTWKQSQAKLMYNKLANLLKGKPLVAHGSEIFAIKLPQHLDLCINLVAEKLIASHVTSSNQQTARCLADVIVHLWMEIPRFGQLLLAHFYRKCPYLIPLHPDCADDNEMRTHEMSRLMGLFAAITASQPTVGFKKHPFGLERAWHWLASFLNMEPTPHPNISADLLLTFLEIVSPKLRLTYGTVFTRILGHIWHSYTPILNGDDVEGPVVKLMKFIQAFSSTM